MPLLYLLMQSIRRHYDHVKVDWLAADQDEGDAPVARARDRPGVEGAQADAAGLAFARCDAAVVARGLTVDVDRATAALAEEWDGGSIPCRSRCSTRPTASDATDPRLRQGIRRASPRDLVIVYVPEYVVGRWWEQVLHKPERAAPQDAVAVPARRDGLRRAWQLGLVGAHGRPARPRWPSVPCAAASRVAPFRRPSSPPSTSRPASAPHGPRGRPRRPARESSSRSSGSRTAATAVARPRGAGWSSCATRCRGDRRGRDHRRGPGPVTWRGDAVARALGPRPTGSSPVPGRRPGRCGGAAWQHAAVPAQLGSRPRCCASSWSGSAGSTRSTARSTTSVAVPGDRDGLAGAPGSGTPSTRTALRASTGTGRTRWSRSTPPAGHRRGRRDRRHAALAWHGRGRRRASSVDGDRSLVVEPRRRSGPAARRRGARAARGWVSASRRRPRCVAGRGRRLPGRCTGRGPRRGGPPRSDPAGRAPARPSGVGLFAGCRSQPWGDGRVDAVESSAAPARTPGATWSTCPRCASARARGGAGCAGPSRLGRPVGRPPRSGRARCSTGCSTSRRGRRLRRLRPRALGRDLGLCARPAGPWRSVRGFDLFR